MASKHSKVAINHAKEDIRTVVVIITMAGIRTVVDTTTVVDTIIAEVIITVVDTIIAEVITKADTASAPLIMIQMQNIQ